MNGDDDFSDEAAGAEEGGSEEALPVKTKNPLRMNHRMSRKERGRDKKRSRRKHKRSE